jgi:hypothetical protein
VLGPPGQDREGIQIRPQILIALIDADEALNAASVDHDFVVYGLLNLAGRDGHILQLTENIGELHPDKFHIPFPDHADDVFLRIPAHDSDLQSTCFFPETPFYFIPAGAAGFGLRASARRLHKKEREQDAPLFTAPLP